ncbi:MAG: B12-binding domain-containing radical SAM protein [Candidatus Nitrohelix vancouverensis]|uniref:B12-binding domain-containing radical SAM protein n=1 Tax=Candidatus Nitrohelix vancouverensis TaxID=2705534 RepID=A0A7T0C2E5_9BACT|nr:MAG: B12-binding domain-containing radical SAM protein [Candidatus Nitrohelix vancouverensis]
MKIDVLLIRTRSDYLEFAEGFVEPPQGLLAVAAPLIEKGLHVKIIDQRVERNWKEQIESILKEKPICVGMGSMSGPQLYHTMEMAKWVKQVAPDQVVVLGGPHVTMSPMQMIDSPSIDIVVPFEGEVTFLELVETLANKGDLNQVKGLYFKNSEGEVIKTAIREGLNVNELPTQPYDLIDIKHYTSNVAGEPSMGFFPDRGCPHICAFCNVNEYFTTTKTRIMSAENIVKNMRSIAALGVKIIAMGDSNFLGSVRRIRQLAEILANEDIGLKIKCSGRVDDINRLDDELLLKLRKVGFYAFQVGIESGSDRMLEFMDKKIMVKDIVSANQKMKRADIIPLMSFMGGMPGEGVEDGQKTMELMMQLTDDNPNIRMTNLQLYRLLPGNTKFWQIAEQEYGVKYPENYEAWYNIWCLGHPWLSEKDKKQFEMWDLMSYFIDHKSVVEYYNRWWTRLLVPVYSKVVRWRIRNKFYKFMPELAVVKWRRGDKIYYDFYPDTKESDRKVTPEELLNDKKWQRTRGNSYIKNDYVKGAYANDAIS